MKLAVIRRQFAATGGAELYLQRLIAALASAGHEVHLLAQAWDHAGAGVTPHLLPIVGSRSERPRLFAEAVDHELARDRYDCVFSLERTLRQDVYRAGDGVHRVWIQRRRQFAPWWRKPFIGWGGFHRTMRGLEGRTFAPENTRHVIVNSEMVRREIVDTFGFPASRLHLVRNGVEVDRLRRGDRAATRARLGVRDDDYLLLFAGSGWERKGLGFLLQTFHAMRGLESADRLKLLVVGKGTKPWRPRRGVIYAGPMSDLENAYAAADLFTFLPIYEPAANVCHEAMAAGLPVVTTAHNGASEIIQAGVNGTVISDPSDTASVVRAIQHWRSKARGRVSPDLNELSLERNVRETMAVLELAAREKAGAK